MSNTTDSQKELNLPPEKKPTVMPECPSVIGRIFGHKFQARFHEEPVLDSPQVPIDVLISAMRLRGDGDSVGSAIERSIGAYQRTKLTYVCDICVRCGHTIDSQYP